MQIYSDPVVGGGILKFTSEMVTFSLSSKSHLLVLTRQAQPKIQLKIW
ncbi:MAG: hypothetical protein CM15mP122_5250 [Bacteroidota bacterium]|nr:MAG: hypothetical protein CM15mP122_5250 [Bacteroidota bacterium]